MTKNAARGAKFRAIAEACPTSSELEWMARRGELLSPRPCVVDDPSVSSHLFGPVLRVVQSARIEYTCLERSTWNK